MEEFDNIQTSAEQSNVSQIDFQKYIRGVWKRKILVIFCAIVVAVPFYLKARNQVPIYRAYVNLKIRSIDKDAGEFWNNERKGEIRSRTFINRVTARLGLAIVLRDTSIKSADDVFFKHYTSEEPVTGNYKIRIDEAGNYFFVFMDSTSGTILDSANVWDAVASERSGNGITFQLQPNVVEFPKEIRFRVIPIDKAANEINKELKVNFFGNSSYMILQMNGTDPDLLPKKLNRIAEVYVDESLNLKSRDTNLKRDIIAKQLRTAEVKVNQVEADLRNFYSRYPLTLDGEKQRLLDRLKDYDKALRELPRQRNQLTEYLDRLEQADNEPDPDQYRSFIINEIVNNPMFANETKMAILRQQLLQLEKEYNRLFEEFSPDHPELVEVNESKKQTHAEIINFASNFRNTLAKRESEYRSDLDKIQSQLNSLPQDQYRFMELERKKKINEDIYSYLFQEMQKMELSDAIEENEIAILDRAIRPTTPINPSKMSRVMLGGGLGFLIGVVLSILLEISDKKIRSFTDVERQLKLPVLGAIPVVKFTNIKEYQDFEKAKQIDRQLVTHDYSPTPIGESYRALRTHLMFSKNTGRIHTLLITSISPEEGKSFTASNLSIILAQQRTNTLLVDADLRRGVLHNTFGMKKEPGFTNYLNNRVTLSSVVQQTHVPNLSIISCGSMIPNPSELLGSNQMKRFIDEARRKFDFILFDAPPLEAATDGVVIGTQVDAVACVVKSGQTNRKIAQEKLEILSNVNVNLIGVILNGTETALLNDTYSYYHY
ncbi:polysaccharide biosynthesis tyrosine autokinase [candidate division KSB1 bacterium]|nr:polysaccharide biosynthesis tyrosine autokinase [candidate division KSB1 bacterium]